MITCVTALVFILGALLFPSAIDSAGQINEMREFIEERGKSLSVSRFYKKATPYTIVSIAGLALLLFINVQLTRILHQEIFRSARRW